MVSITKYRVINKYENKTRCCYKQNFFSYDEDTEIKTISAIGIAMKLLTIYQLLINIMT